MKPYKSPKLVLFILVGFILFSFNSNGQVATDIACQTNIFYGLSGGDVHALELNGATLTDQGVIAPSTNGLYALAFGSDITQNSSNRTFYSTKPDQLFTSTSIMRYTGTAWDSITSDTLIYHNAGAYGPFVYFQHMTSVSSNQNDQCISRLNANGTLTKIFTDTSLVFSVADISVDEFGNIYCFRGTAISFTTELTVISPTGTILNSISTNLNNLGTIYGSMFLNGTLYIGWNTNNGRLFPVNINGATATLGTGIVSPVGITYKDLANCHELVTKNGIDDLANYDDLDVYPNPSNGNVMIKTQEENALLTIFDAQGKMIVERKKITGEYLFNPNEKGLYLISILREGKVTTKKVIVE